MKKQRLIYTLNCPFTDEVHYVGKSTQGMLRPLSHLTNSHSEKIKEWVAALKELGHAPVVKVIEYVSLEEDIDARELFYIQKELNKGSLLLNSCLIKPLLINPMLSQILGEGPNFDFLHIATAIKERRKKLNLTQEVFADKTAVALTVIRKLEQGKTNVNLESLIQVLKMLNLKLDIKQNM